MVTADTKLVAFVGLGEMGVAIGLALTGDTRAANLNSAGDAGIVKSAHAESKIVANRPVLRDESILLASVWPAAVDPDDYFVVSCRPGARRQIGEQPRQRRSANFDHRRSFETRCR